MLIMKYAYVAKIYNMECANLQNSTLGDNICQGYIRPNTLPPLCNNPDSRPFLFSLLPSLPLFLLTFLFPFLSSSLFLLLLPFPFPPVPLSLCPLLFKPCSIKF